MLTESFILLILALMFCYFTLRSGRQGTVLLMLPLLVVPGVNVMGFALAPQLDKLTPALSAEDWRVLFVLGALAVTMALVGGISNNIKRRGVRRGYLFVIGGFTLIFSFLILVASLPNL